MQACRHSATWAGANFRTWQAPGWWDREAPSWAPHAHGHTPAPRVADFSCVVTTPTFYIRNRGVLYNNAVYLVQCTLFAPLLSKFILKIPDAGISVFTGTLLKAKRPRVFSDLTDIQRNEVVKRNRHKGVD